MSMLDLTLDTLLGAAVEASAAGGVSEATAAAADAARHQRAGLRHQPLNGAPRLVPSFPLPLSARATARGSPQYGRRPHCQEN
jgi:hypothetical protein